MKVVNKGIRSVDGKGIMMGRPAFTDDLASLAYLPQVLARHLIVA